MSRKIILFDSFKGGEFGRLGETNAPDDTFTATNMIVYRTGELGVRAGLIARNPSGLSNGVVHGFASTPVPLNDLAFVQGTAVRTFSSAGDNLKTSGTALAETPSAAMDWVQDSTTVLFASPADKIYRVTPETGATNPTVAGLTGSPGARCVAVYGDRIVAANIDGSHSYRLRYSDAANADSWPSGNFIDVGDRFGIYRLDSQRLHLLIAKQGAFHVLTGVPGVNDVLRKVSNSQGILHPGDGRMDTHGRLWYQGLFNTYPSMFNGAIETPVAHLEYTTALPGNDSATPQGRGVVPISENGDGVAFISDTGDRCALLMNGIWTYHTFGVPVSGYAAGNGRFVYFCDGGGVSATPNFYVWDPTVDSPGIEGGSQMRAGDDSSTALTGSVSLPEWFAKDGAEVYVRSVIVDFRSWNTGSATTNHFDLTVNARRRYQAGSAQASTTVSFDEAAASSSASGTLQRRIFGFGEQGRGNGFQLAFTNCRGIAIRRIEVIIDSEPARI